jgi:hypothetical protein
MAFKTNRIKFGFIFIQQKCMKAKLIFYLLAAHLSIKAYTQQNCQTTCEFGDLPSLVFKTKSLQLTKKAKAKLDSISNEMRKNPFCNIKIVSYSSKQFPYLYFSWAKANSVMDYLITFQGIAENRFVFQYGVEGNPSIVDLVDTIEEPIKEVPKPPSRIAKYQCSLCTKNSPSSTKAVLRTAVTAISSKCL